MNEGDFIIRLLGLDGLEVINMESDSSGKMIIQAQMKRKPHHCPICNFETDRIHDYRKQTIKVDPINDVEVEIILRKRRYSCPHCSKRFFEEIPWLKRYQRKTNKVKK